MERNRKKVKSATLLLAGLAMCLATHTGTAAEGDAVGLAIEKRMLQAGDLKIEDFRASSEEGIVTLAGKADNLDASRRVATLAEEVRGVKSVVNQVVVTAPEVSDDALVDTIVQRMSNNPSFDASQLGVQADNGKVQLKGIVNSLAEKMIIETEVASTRGVSAVENNLEIRPAVVREDAEIQKIVQSLFENSALLDTSEIEVTVEDGVVKLAGEIPSTALKREAAELASISGVKQIDDDALKVVWEKSDGMQRKARYDALSDKQIESAIKLAAQNHPYLAGVADSLKVEVSQRSVTLKGEFPSPLMREAADKIATNTLGVYGVTNEIDVTWPDETPTDEAITEAVLASIREDAYLSRAEIVPRTKSAHVHLYGAVDSPFEKQRAARLAGMQPGVVHVANYLSVIDNFDNSQTDAEIQQAIERELSLMASNPHVDLHVRVMNGVPVFSGHVATWFQWQGLLQVAERAGARRPHLDVDIHYRPTSSEVGLFVPQ
ncbi:MAG: hypothetical protein CMO55_01390 [Verrucomicrobiales bacterium]|nr:hypothetical protein [Verrucomicrobiales bacterium]